VVRRTSVSRSDASGQAPKALPVLRHDGSEVLCRVLIEKLSGSAHLAWLTPTADDPTGRRA